MRIIRNITHSGQIEVPITLEAIAMILAEQNEAAADYEAVSDRTDALFQEYRKTGKVVEWDEAALELDGLVE